MGSMRGLKGMSLVGHLQLAKSDLNLGEASLTEDTGASAIAIMRL
jgi:K+/H+ antiporter YhaU regulatory subunit KhtT